MPKARSKPNTYDIELITRAIQERFCVVVSDYQSLQNLLITIGNAGYKTELGWNTWRRLFGFIQNNHSQSITTLNILADFAGFTSWVEFLQSNTLETERDFQQRFAHYVAGNIGLPDIESAYNSLGPTAAFYRFVKQCLIVAASHKDARIINNIYYDNLWFPFNVKNKEAAYEEFIVHQLVGIYCFHKNVPDFTKTLMESPTGLKKVLQYCVNYGPSAIVYMNCFEQAFEQGLFNEEEDFAISILAYHSFLLGDKLLNNKWADMLNNYEINSARLLPAGRIRVIKWAQKMQHDIVSDEEIEKTVRLDFLVFKDKARHLDAFSFYLLYVIRYLFHAKRFDLAFKIMRTYYVAKPATVSFWSGVIWNRLRIYLAGIYCHLNKAELAQETLARIRPEWFDTFQFEHDRKDYELIKSSYFVKN